ncbi:hypothetical protein SEVIR_9G211755v4 [Setaria viridis]
MTSLLHLLSSLLFGGVKSRTKSSFRWKDIMKLCDQYRGITACMAGDGSTILTWNDVWNGSYLRDQLPRLFSFAKDENVSLAQFLVDSSPQTLPYITVTTGIGGTANFARESWASAAANNQRDGWKYCWGDGNYSSRKYYSLLFRSITPPPPFDWIWKAEVTKKN